MANIEDLVIQAAQQHGVSPQLALALAKAESGLNQNKVSSAGAVGVMQMTPVAAASVGYSWQDMFDTIKNIHAGIKYFQRLLNQFGDTNVAVAAYNAGPTYMSNIINRYGIAMGNWINKVYDETRSHVLKVSAYYKQTFSSGGYGSFFTGTSGTFPGQTGITGILTSIWDKIFGTREEQQPPSYPGPSAGKINIIQQYQTEDIATIAILGVGGMVLLSELFD